MVGAAERYAVREGEDERAAAASARPATATTAGGGRSQERGGNRRLGAGALNEAQQAVMTGTQLSERAERREEPASQHAAYQRGRRLVSGPQPAPGEPGAR